jgi:hypothetical protein
MPSPTYEDSIRMDDERVWMIDRIMDSLGFTRHKIHRSSAVPGQFTDLIIYLSDKSKDWVNVSFPNEEQYDRGLQITTQAKFNNKIESPEWQSLYGFGDQIAAWIEKCRGQERPHG